MGDFKIRKCTHADIERVNYFYNVKRPAYERKDAQVGEEDIAKVIEIGKSVMALDCQDNVVGHLGVIVKERKFLVQHSFVHAEVQQSSQIIANELLADMLDVIRKELAPAA